MENKIAFVTGGTSGIGKEIVLRLLDKGCYVITCYNNNEKNANELRNISNDKLIVKKCDVSNEQEVKLIIDFIKETYGHLDYLINNAGTFIASYIKEFDIEDFKKVININFIGKVICSKLSYPIMKEKGAIVNISSSLGITPCEESAAYCASAAAIINFTKASALEFSDKLIRVNSICPSFTPTPLALRGWTKEEIEEKIKNTPLKRLNTVEDTANLCLFLLSEEASFISGENISINGARLK